MYENMQIVVLYHYNFLRNVRWSADREGEIEGEKEEKESEIGGREKEERRRRAGGANKLSLQRQRCLMKEEVRLKRKK